MHENAFPFLVDKHTMACKMVENGYKHMLFRTPKPIILRGKMRHIAIRYDLLWDVKWLKQKGEMAFIGNRCLFILFAFQKTLLNYHNIPFHLFHGKRSRTCRISRNHVGTHGSCVHSNGPATRLLAHAFSCSALRRGATLHPSEAHILLIFQNHLWTMHKLLSPKRRYNVGFRPPL